MDFYQSLPSLAKGNVAQQIFWYTAFTASMVEPKSKGNNTVDDKGMPLWRMAPSPHGPYWQPGVKIGYQDAGSWTLLKSTPLERRKAAWLYAQFTVSKTVDVKKSHTGLTFIRDSTVKHQSFTERAPKLGGLVEFYRSPARVAWTPTGTNVPDYPKLAQLWWQNIGEAVAGSVTPEKAMDNLAEEQDKVMARIERSGLQGECGPKMNPPQAEEKWLAKDKAPHAKLANEKPKGETVPYEKLLQAWKEGRAM
jgi:glycerol transport system substrate-binding protein